MLSLQGTPEGTKKILKKEVTNTAHKVTPRDITQETPVVTARVNSNRISKTGTWRVLCYYHEKFGEEAYACNGVVHRNTMRRCQMEGGLWQER